MILPCLFCPCYSMSMTCLSSIFCPSFSITHVTLTVYRLSTEKGSSIGSMTFSVSKRTLKTCLPLREFEDWEDMRGRRGFFVSRLDFWHCNLCLQCPRLYGRPEYNCHFGYLRTVVLAQWPLPWMCLFMISSFDPCPFMNCCFISSAWSFHKAQLP